LSGSRAGLPVYAGPAAPRLGCLLVLVLEGCACSAELVSAFSALVDAVGVGASDIQAIEAIEAIGIKNYA